jgi:HSP20 family protein
MEMIRITQVQGGGTAMAMRSVWNPASEFVSLREAMDRLVADSFISPRSLLGSVGNGVGLPASLYEDGEGYIVQVMLPGVDPEKVEVTTRGATLRIKGERVAPQFEGAQQIWSGIGYGPFEQTFSLPTAAQADYENGLLTLRLPKAQHARAHTISIGKGSQKAIEATASK